MRSKRGPSILLAALSIVASGCASAPSPERSGQLAAYQQALAERDRQIATLRYHYGLVARDHAVLRARLEQAARAQRLVMDKLEELNAVNARIETQLTAAEQQLERSSGEDGSPSAQDSDELVAEQIELLRQLRQAHAARNEVMQDLARTVQYLVDTGQLHISQGEGRPSVTAPRSLDIEDPWRYR